MSHTSTMIVFAVLDLAVTAALAVVCVMPFRLGRRPAVTVVQISRDRLEPERWAA